MIQKRHTLTIDDDEFTVLFDHVVYWEYLRFTGMYFAATPVKFRHSRHSVLSISTSHMIQMVILWYLNYAVLLMSTLCHPPSVNAVFSHISRHCEHVPIFCGHSVVCVLCDSHCDQCGTLSQRVNTVFVHCQHNEEKSKSAHGLHCVHTMFYTLYR